uniref:Transcription factor A, mitochondrial n=1 Tax=Lygus hesperus TaxID=30085 RepID=A0A0A9WJY4_LYGHE
MLSLISRFNGLNLSYHRAITCHRISSSPQSRRITLEDKIGIRPKPKRPMSAFLKFSSNIVRPNLIKDNPSLPITQVTKIAAERWKSVDDDTKKKLAKEYQDEMVGYRAAMVEYLKELSTVDSKLLEKHDPKLRKEKLALKKKRFELGCPKRPLTAYLSYLQTRRSEQGNVPYKDWVSKMAEVWKNLDASEKAKYVQRYEHDKAAFVQQMAAWEKKMRDSGNAHLLNTGTQQNAASGGIGGSKSIKPKSSGSTKDS